MNDALENIRNEVNAEGEELISSTAELTRMVVMREYEIYAEGKVVFDMTGLVNRHMRILAEKVLKSARNAWKHVRYANEFWFIGGGAIVLQPWIEKLNAELGLPLRFDTAEYGLSMDPTPVRTDDLQGSEEGISNEGIPNEDEWIPNEFGSVGTALNSSARENHKIEPTDTRGNRRYAPAF